ncbi:hypothetical protein [Aeromicrobium sp.]|uniref:hypothetical protein n=1 Tax=Aeromicrobium sp. TaxID=1871063 RepID=UPI0019BA2BBB|nr:hypothetical protein [Aeromicrobium sp.]MBC7632789.1 hypothetical protein [Aeromicrobium sp.]
MAARGDVVASVGVEPWGFALGTAMASSVAVSIEAGLAADTVSAGARAAFRCGRGRDAPAPPAGRGPARPVGLQLWQGADRRATHGDRDPESQREHTDAAATADLF